MQGAFTPSLWMSTMRELSLLIRATDEPHARWAALCLDRNLLRRGGSPSHAIEALLEAIALAGERDAAAPAADWELFQRTLRTGVRVAAGDLDVLPGGAAIVAAVMYVAERAHELPPAPPFVIAALSQVAS